MRSAAGGLPPVPFTIHARHRHSRVALGKTCPRLDGRIGFHTAFGSGTLARADRQEPNADRKDDADVLRPRITGTWPATRRLLVTSPGSRNDAHNCLRRRLGLATFRRCRLQPGHRPAVGYLHHPRSGDGPDEVPRNALAQAVAVSETSDPAGDGLSGRVGSRPSHRSARRWPRDDQEGGEDQDPFHLGSVERNRRPAETGADERKGEGGDERSGEGAQTRRSP